MSIEEKRRAAFEAWYWREFWSVHAHERSTIFNRYGGVGGYRNWDVQRQWISWRAALDSMVIDLPAPPAIDGNRETYTRTQSAYHQGMLAVINAIESSGLKVKP